jgi:hypothetical protein
MEKILIIVVIIIAILIFIWYYQCNKRSREPFSQDHVQYNGNNNEYSYNEYCDDSSSGNNGNSNDSDDNDNDSDRIMKKFMTRDHACGDKYKHDDYARGERGGDADKAFEYIDKSNDLMQSEHECADQFLENDETDGQYAPYKQDDKKIDKYKTSEIFDCNNYLPDEKAANPDWFDIVPEPVDVKNRHLINVSKPIGINTIGTSLRNPSYDIRGSPPNPKNVVSPWGNSTIEYDNNLKSLC